MTNVMKTAWEIAYEGVAKFGGQVKEYFAEALRIAWDLFKKGGNKVDYAEQVKGTVGQINVPEIEGTEKQVAWATEIRKNAVAALNQEVIREEYEEVSLLPNTKPKTQRRDVGSLLGPLQSKEGIQSHFDKMEAQGLSESRMESTIETMNNLLDRFNRVAEILQNADAKFWIDNRDNQSKNHAFNKFIKYVNTGVKEF